MISPSINIQKNCDLCLDKLTDIKCKTCTYIICNNCISKLQNQECPQCRRSSYQESDNKINNWYIGNDIVDIVQPYIHHIDIEAQQINTQTHAPIKSYICKKIRQIFTFIIYTVTFFILTISIGCLMNGMSENDITPSDDSLSSILLVCMAYSLIGTLWLIIISLCLCCIRLCIFCTEFNRAYY